MLNKIIGSDGQEIKLNIEVHPGEVLKDEINARGFKISNFAMRIGVYPAHLLEITKKKRNITANIALRLEKELSIEAEFWLRLQIDYDLYRERKKFLQTPHILKNEQV
ncbi:HigA family addiction module antitoxin [Adhaeribacter pallidiroseus]|uniref:Antitoxin HigA n=1 Tax=Adhaeribacter pallidiroseus TaxID=2072847 RepID=A0A369QED0_9BACT|nr:HigA family addiction module antitoxin [Adhaeribacter pallidiroseus]RDC63271.1 Antitoxin HigA [Adhaeribacter pallidiroseus]